jgi:hypothetical protein
VTPPARISIQTDLRRSAICSAPVESNAARSAGINPARECFQVLIKDHLFTSESVSEGLPEFCDQISDAILDAFIANDVKLARKHGDTTSDQICLFA